MKIGRLFIALSLCLGLGATAANPKREFRGAWLHTVHQAQYAKMTPDECRAYLKNQLDSLQAAGVNAILFQVRPSADAFYDSKLEPWSRFLTKDGQAPVPYWDPLQFMIDESHNRGMELHAWLNPYRVTTSPGEKVAPNHLYNREPERFVTYEGDSKMYFDPGLPENRKFIVDVVEDIITRYDVDGIHCDDYFYPYPAKDKDFPDAGSYAKYGNGMDRGDWRRQNVDNLIREIHEMIAAKKPWVIFGISPFGIWRNKKTDPRGSDTNGLQNYDALYADVLLWSREGWIDYLLPQLYWELEHKAAPYEVLVKWWAENNEGRHMYIGQDVNKTMKLADLAPSTEKSQLHHKMQLCRENPNIQGICWWPGYSVVKNIGGVADSLMANEMSTMALPPSYPWISQNKPAKVRGLNLDGRVLRWPAPQAAGTPDDVVKYVVYRFDDEDDARFNTPNGIVAITYKPEYTITKPGVYYVTAVTRVNNESTPSQAIIIE